MEQIRLLPDYRIKMQTSTVEHINYNHALHDIPEKWRETKGEGVKIAILDTGVPNHRDLAGKIKAYENFTDDLSPLDTDGHGTHVAGIISAESKNPNVGIIGMAPKAELYIAKVINSNGGGDDRALANAIRWCIEQKVDIINMSLGASSDLESKFILTRQAIKDASQQNVFMFAAAGNESSNKINIPAKWNEVFAIGAIDKEQKHAAFSNCGPELDFSGMGVNVMSTYLNNTYCCLDGTSMAGPDIAAVSALIISDHKNGRDHSTPVVTFMDLREHLIRMCTDLGPKGYDQVYGWGNPVFGQPSASLDTKESGGLVMVQNVPKLPWYKRLIRFIFVA